MRKFLKIVILLVVITPINIKAISASSYIVMDQNSNQILYGSNYDSSSLIASITKIMTAIIVLENCDIDEVITVGEEVLTAYGSAVYIEVGEEISVRDLLYGLMLRSGNDATTVLAYHVAGSLENFALLMNEKVTELDLENTTFLNPSGLDEETENKSTAYDMAVIMSYAMKNETFKTITSTEYYETKSSYKKYTWENKNKLLGTYDYITGGKTGYTEKAYRTLVTTASYDNMDIVVVTLNDGNDWIDHITLYETVFSNYEAIKVISKDITSFEDNNNSYYVKNDYYALIKKSDDNNIDVKYSIYDKAVNDIYGKVSVYLNNEIIYEDNIYLIEETTESLSWWQKILSWFKLW